MKITKLLHEDVLSMLPDRAHNAHKGDFGKIMLLCGSRGYTGAAALSALGALRSGAGLVYLCVPESIYQIEAVKLLEPIILPMCDHDGLLSEKCIQQIADMLSKMDAVLVGPGLGQSDDICRVVTWVLENFDGTIVLDADGINALKEHKNLLRGRTCPTIITPHEGEFLRFGGELTDGRLAGAMELAADLGIIVVLKGHETIITDGVNCYINTTGNPGMAVGGCGDILAGMITSLLGQKLIPIHAAAAAVWLHGAAGDLCADSLGQYGMLPSDMLQVLPRLMK